MKDEDLSVVGDKRLDSAGTATHIKKYYVCKCGKVFQTKEELSNHIFDEEYD